MSRRIEKGWLVIQSLEDDAGLHCVDLFRRGDGTFGFETFRRDPEDQGRWTPIGGTVALVFAGEHALRAAVARYVPWAGGAR